MVDFGRHSWQINSVIKVPRIIVQEIQKLFEWFNRTLGEFVGSRSVNGGTRVTPFCIVMNIQEWRGGGVKQTS